MQLVIFGDSYSSPTGSGVAWIKELCANWQPKLILNLAEDDHSIEYDLPSQIRRFKKHVQAGSVDPIDQTIFSEWHPTWRQLLLNCTVFWLGINDCGSCHEDEIEGVLEKYFDAMHKLYKECKARNMIIMDLPPVDRSPYAVASRIVSEMRINIETFNDLLDSYIGKFRSTHLKSNLELFSSHQILSCILDYPGEYSFTPSDVTQTFGGIWYDGLHLTEEAMRWIGVHLREELSELLDTM